MGKHSVIELTTGASGTGKSYTRAGRWIIDEFLPDYDGVHVSNFPINIEPMAELAFKKRGIPKEQTRARIKLIPAEVLKSWEDGTSGPWDYFRDWNLDCTHIAIDEVHVYCGENRPKKVWEQWQKWIGDIRHAGATIEFLSQTPHKVAECLRQETGVRREFIAAAHRRDPFCRIPLGDWYELLAAIRQKWHESIIAHEYRQDKNGKWEHTFTYRTTLNPAYFPVYDSYNKTREDGKSGKGERQQWQKRSPPGVFWWFIRKHWWRSLPPVAMLAFILYLLSGGGGTIMHGIFSVTSGAFTPKVSASSGDGKHQAGGSAVTPQPRGDGIQLQDLAQVSPQATTQPAIPPEVTAELERMRADLAEAKRQELLSWSIALLTPETVSFRAGYKYNVGDVIDYGPFIDQTVDRIDYARRTVHLSGGGILRMGNAWRVPNSPGAGREREGSRVPEPVPPAPREPPSR